MIQLVSTLRNMNHVVCNVAADSIESSIAAGQAVNLHLRNAGMSAADISLLAVALEGFSTGCGQSLASFSVSYNTHLGDSGAMTLARVLPQSLIEVGFVGCNIHDQGAQALLQWANQAQNLEVICIEQNELSDASKLLFREFAEKNPDATVIF